MAYGPESYVVTDTGCWEWLGTKQNGYGLCSARLLGVPEVAASRKGWRVFAHRAFYALHIGPIPDGMEVRHRCDNPICVNPGHLELGTHADNMRDIAERGRPTRPRLDRCKNGHDYNDPGNVIVEASGRRKCRACTREVQRRHDRKRRSVDGRQDRHGGRRATAEEPGSGDVLRQ